MKREASHRIREPKTGRTEKAVLWCNACHIPRRHTFEIETPVFGYSARGSGEVKRGLLYKRLIFCCECGMRRDWGNEVPSD